MAGNFGSGWNAPTWSTSAECFAYLSFALVVPIFLAVSDDHLRSTATAVASLLVLIIIFKLAEWPLGKIIGISALLRVLCKFACGAAPCRILTNGRRLPRFTGDIVGSGAFLSFALGASSYSISDFIIVPCLALFVCGAAVANGPLRYILSCAPIVWLGEVSHSIYLNHMPSLWILRPLWERLGFLTWSGDSKAAAIALTAFIIVLVSACLFYCVERPLRADYRDRCGKLVLPQ